MNELNLKNTIPVAALKAEYNGCKFAAQCDMGSRYDRELANAIKIVLDWFNTPAYETRLDCCGFKENDSATNEELIKTMCTEDFNKFLFNFKTDAVTKFLISGGLEIMNVLEQAEWLKSRNKEYLFELMRGTK